MSIRGNGFGYGVKAGDKCYHAVRTCCGLGRIVQLDGTLRNICPHKRVALAVLLSEGDSYGHEHKRGVNTMTVPAHTQDGCHDVTVRCIKFVLSEDRDVSNTTKSICNTRKFKARFIAHYIDSDFDCCCCDSKI